MRVREAVMVYLEPGERELLERVAKKTGLARTEILRRGLWQMASRELGEAKPGSAFRYLVETASDADVPADLSSRSDGYLYADAAAGAKNKPPPAKKRARVR